ncbi:unnamed protein product [Hermetia illucens]|uniref:Uncharacterized protein n=1 Tax=Hermetia illucens TaxID=343691 RepID=A0A7R8US48_HERIL|nr:unnamed protein product [Hermetia illucens]
MQNFKILYRKAVVYYILKKLEDTLKLPEVSILEAIKFAQKAGEALVTGDKTDDNEDSEEEDVGTEEAVTST